MIRTLSLFSLCFLLLTFVSCKQNSVAPLKQSKDLVFTAADQQKAGADNAFTFKLFKTLSATNPANKNLFISPLSVSLAVGMVSNGSNGQTLNGIRNAMNFNDFDQSEVNSYYEKLITGLPQVDPNVTVNIANSIWYDQHFNLLPQFSQTNSKYYNSELQVLNFSDPASLTTINNWVSKQTSGKIPTIIAHLSPDDVMCLINAIYFKGIWNQKFDPAQTQKASFYLDASSTVQTDFMSAMLKFNRFNDNQVSVLELPYADNKFSMVIAMPLDGTPVNNVVADLDLVKWQSWMAKLQPDTRQVILPKFKIAYGTNLKDALTALGMGIVFTNSADFKRIDGVGGLKISGVNHKAFIEVNEDGTEAAAATIIGIAGVTNVMADVSNINHPFIFAIREVKTGLILFVGTVNNPQLPTED